MDIFRSLSKILPLLVFPLGLTGLLILLALFLQRSRWQKGVLILAFLLLTLAGSRWVTLQLARGLEWQYSPPQGPVQADVIVVLASNSLPARFPRAIPEVGEVGDRLIFAAYLYQQGAAPLILHSGGAELAQADLESGGDVRRLLEIMGVPPEAVLLETGSHNTHENALACQQLLAERGLRRVLLVTSAAHMPRAAGAFRRAGVEVIPAPTGYTATQGDAGISLHSGITNFLVSLLPNADNFKTTTRMLNEYLGLLIYRLRGWL